MMKRVGRSARRSMRLAKCMFSPKRTGASVGLFWGTRR
jgi:hypothetical protein